MELNAEALKELSKEYGEAFYFLDSACFRQNFLELKQAFSSLYSKFNLAYSYKTNYTPKLCRIVNELGGYAEVVSEMEAELALKVGVLPEHIIWNGPIKSQEALEQFLLLGVNVNIDSWEEAEVIECIAKEHQETPLYVGIRCNFDVGDGVTSRFGFDVEGEAFQKTLELVQKTRNLQLKNLQCHFAKRQVEYWPSRVQGMLRLMERIGIVPERIDLGGGLFGKMDEKLKAQFTCRIPRYQDYAQEAAVAIAQYFKEKETKPEFLLEPGSALVGDCMKFAATVKSIKNVRGKMTAAVLGSQKNINMTGVNPPLEVYAMGGAQQEYADLDFTGYTCIESDVLYRGYQGPLACGDMVVISNCGSYSLVMKPPFILPDFPVLDISEGRTEVIKRKETFEDIFQTFYF